MFSEGNQVFIVSPTEEKSEQIGVYSIAELPRVISQLASETGIEHIKIAGGSKYAELVEYGILQNEQMKFGNSNLKVEVI